MAQEIADSTLLDTWASGGNIVEPDITKIIEGWQLGEQPPHEYMNWLQNTFGSKLNHILKNGVASWNNETEYLAGSSVQHNGNVWLCKTTNTNSEPTDVNANWKRIITVESLTDLSDYYVALTGNQTIAGVKTFSSTISGSINGNSATATKLETARTINGVAFDGTANITVSDTTAVKTTGNETIAGVKTFSSSPIVPTPTDSTQVANKDYVDSKAEVAFVANDARVKTALNASGTAPIYACRAWVNFNGTGTVAIRASGNVSSITDNGTGDYTVNFTTAMPNANYSVSTSYNMHQAVAGSNSSLQVSSNNYSINAVSVKAWYGTAGAGNDVSIANVAVFV